jgi:hypothetical protein
MNRKERKARAKGKIEAYKVKIKAAFDKKMAALIEEHGEAIPPEECSQVNSVVNAEFMRLAKDCPQEKGLIVDAYISFMREMKELANDIRDNMDELLDIVKGNVTNE